MSTVGPKKVVDISAQGIIAGLDNDMKRCDKSKCVDTWEGELQAELGMRNALPADFFDKFYQPAHQTRLRKELAVIVLNCSQAGSNSTKGLCGLLKLRQIKKGKIDDTSLLLATCCKI